MFATAILGAGPGGTGPLIYAAQQGLLDRWLSTGVAILDRTASFGGTLGRYIVNSDSLGGVYLECLQAPAARRLFARMQAEPVTDAIRTYADGYPPLPIVGEFFERLGCVLEGAVRENAASAFCENTEARAVHLRADGSVEIDAVCGDVEITVRARTCVIALGGRPILPGDDADLPDEIPLRSIRSKLVASDLLVTDAGLRKARALLNDSRRPRVVILGGAHSAYSAAWLLTEMLPDVRFEDGAITIACRRKPKIYYRNANEAHADGYSFSSGDICPKTKRVNRMAGLRGDGRHLWRRMARRSGVTPEDRVRLLTLHSQDDAELTRAAVEEADLIVSAFGYCARTIPVYDSQERRLPLRGDNGRAAVDDKARIVLSDGTPLPNIFGIGMGHGFHPHGEMGGEPNFCGQANSLWLYQNHIGARVYDGIQAYLQASAGLYEEVRLVTAAR